MSCRGVREHPAVRVDRDAHGRRHLPVAHVTQQASHDRPRRDVVVRVRAERVAKLSHQRRRRDSATRDVADRQVHDPIGPAQHVVPVPSHLEAGAAGLVARGGVDRREWRQARKQAALQGHGDLVLLLVPLSALADVLELGARVRARPGDDPGEQREDEQRHPREQRELEDETASCGREDGGARPVEHDGPVRNRRAGVGDDMSRGAVEPSRVAEDARRGRSEPRGRAAGVCEVEQDRLVLPVEDDESRVPEVDRGLAGSRRLDEQRAGEHARDPTLRVSRRHGHDDDLLLAHA